MSIIVEKNGVVTGSGQNGVVRTRINLVEGSGMRVTTTDGTDPTELSISSATPDGILMVAEGLKGQNFPRQAAAGTSIMIGGTVYFMGIGLAVGDVVTKVMIAVTNVGSAITLSKVGLYDKLGNRLAISADQGSSWQSNGVKEITLTTPYTVTAQDGYYLAVVAAGSTLPTLVRGNNTATVANAITGGMQPHGTLAGQSDLPTSATIITTAAIAYWAGWN